MSRSNSWVAAAPFMYAPLLQAGLEDGRSVGGRSERSGATSVNGGAGVVAPPSPARWWVLAVFSALSALQCIVYLTFGPVATQAQAYWPLTNNDISMLALMSQVRGKGEWGDAVKRCVQVFSPSLPPPHRLPPCH